MTHVFFFTYVLFFYVTANASQRVLSTANKKTSNFATFATTERTRCWAHCCWLTTYHALFSWRASPYCEQKRIPHHQLVTPRRIATLCWISCRHGDRKCMCAGTPESCDDNHCGLILPLRVFLENLIQPLRPPTTRQIPSLSASSRNPTQCHSPLFPNWTRDSGAYLQSSSERFQQSMIQHFVTNEVTLQHQTWYWP